MHQKVLVVLANDDSIKELRMLWNLRSFFIYVRCSRHHVYCELVMSGDQKKVRIAPATLAKFKDRLQLALQRAMPTMTLMRWRIAGPLFLQRANGKIKLRKNGTSFSANIDACFVQIWGELGHLICSTCQQPACST